MLPGMDWVFGTMPCTKNSSSAEVTSATADSDDGDSLTPRVLSDKVGARALTDEIDP